MSRTRRDLLIALAATLLGHGALGAMVNTIETPILVVPTPELEISFSIENEELLPPQRIQVPTPDPEPQVEPPPKAVEVQPNVQREVNPQKAVRIRRTKQALEPQKAVEVQPTPSEPVPDWAQGGNETPAPGPKESSPPGGQVFDLASLSTNGTVPVSVGKNSSASSSGNGSGKGGGGKSGGTGPASVHVPVSIAMLKKRPMPIGDTDFVDARKNYPQSAKNNGIEGTIKVKLLVDAKGQVRGKPILITPLGHGLDQLAIRLAKKLRFSPAIDTNNKPVPATVVWTFRFTLPK